MPLRCAPGPAVTSVVSSETPQSICGLQEVRLGCRDANVTFQSAEVFLLNMRITSCSGWCTLNCTLGDIWRRAAQVLSDTEC